MSRSVWRIAVDAPAYEADDLTGKGAEITGGRWNEKGTAAVYASESRALACLETLVHFGATGLPLNRYLVAIVVPDDLWRAAERPTVERLGVGWDAAPPGRVSLGFGTAWLRSRRSALLVLPSIIVPEESNILLNPLHSAASRVTAHKVRRWTYDARLRTAGA